MGRQPIWAPASAYSDTPGKVLTAEVTGKILQSAAYHNLETFKEARSEVMLFTPYFVPGEAARNFNLRCASNGPSLRIRTPFAA